MGNFKYRAAIFGYKRKAALRKMFRERQATRQKPRKKGAGFPWWDWCLRLTIEHWFRKLPQKPEINVVYRGYKDRRYIIECYPGKSKSANEKCAAKLEAAWKDYKKNPSALIDTYIYWVLFDACDSGDIHDLADSTNKVVSGLMRGYKLSFALGKDSPLADIDRSDPWNNIWVYAVHGSTIPNPKLWEDNRRYLERIMKTAIVIDQPEDCPDAIRIKPRKRIKSRPLPRTGGSNANELVFGIEAETRKRIAIPFTDMRHIFGVGTPGAGKTALMEQLMLTALNAREYVANVYYIDVAKQAAGLDHVEKRGAIFARELDEAYGLINTVWDEMKLRTKRMKTSKTKERKILFFIDEAAQIFDNDEADKLQQAQAAKRLIRMSQLSRAAGIHLVTFTQKPTIDFIPSSYLDNHEGRMCLRVLRMRTATDFMQVDFEWNPTRFGDGEFAMLWPGWMKERYGRGFISDKMR